MAEFARRAVVRLGFLFAAFLIPACDDSSSGAPHPLDPDFGAGGIILMDEAAGYGEVTALALDSGWLYAGGFLNDPVLGPTLRVEKRSAATGALDPGFGSAGVLSVPQEFAPTELVVSGSSIYVIGRETFADSRWRVERRSTATGDLVNGFGAGGVWISDPSPYVDYPECATADGVHLYVAGMDRVPGPVYYRWRIEKIRLDDASHDAGFGAGGVAVVAQTDRQEQAFDILLASGSLYVGGVSIGPGAWQWRLEKRDPVDGDLDGTLDGDGVLLLDHSTSMDALHCLGFDGTALVLAGFDGGPAGFNERWRVEWRSPIDGALLPAHGSGGVMLSDPTPAWDEPFGLAVDTAGLFVVGRENNVPIDSRWRIESFSPTGTRRRVVVADLSSSVDVAVEIQMDANHVYIGGKHGRTGGGEGSWRIEKRSR